ncbi:hypothetical protein [Aeromicrobium sp. Leaf350]|uniref:hypothetical protein n=1 Tax=Aeromicrobium sp. Leaf350 TaxID=2876565 RepID=UPI001E588D1D|nr:hypothetical protein [Aeromicrobium sp. Leaf350]
MAEHRARTRPRRRLARAAVGAVVLFLLVTGTNATGAYWTGSATVTLPTLSSGTLDIGLNGSASDTVALSGLTITDMLPGDSRAATLTVSNIGVESRLRFTVAGRGTGTIATSLQVQLFSGTATNTGNGTVGYSSSCSGASLGPAVTLATSDTTLLTVAASNAMAAIAPNGTQNVCAQVSLPQTATQGAQPRTGTVVLVVTGRSVVR